MGNTEQLIQRQVKFRVPNRSSEPIISKEMHEAETTLQPVERTKFVETVSPKIQRRGRVGNIFRFYAIFGFVVA